MGVVVQLAEHFDNLQPLLLVKGDGFKMKLLVEVGQAVAGCRICCRPIPEGPRLRLSFQMAPLRRDVNEPTRDYYTHVGCVTEAMGSIVATSGQDCWDCGSPPPEGQDLHAHAAFTTFRSSFSFICTKCTTKPRWKMCAHCEVWHPQHLVTQVADADDEVGESPAEALCWEVLSDYVVDHVAPGDWLCEPCASSLGVVTVEWMRNRKAELASERERIRREYERTRQRLKEEDLAPSDQSQS